MEIEFHYYITKGIALRADSAEKEAEIIAYASQYTDDNYKIFTINKDKPDQFKNFVSQTYNIRHPRKTLMHIYPIFHFIPGDPKSITAKRKDKLTNIFNTTPDSFNARKVFKKALESNNLYRIGIASHGFCDTWAHQNFIGLLDSFNAMPGIEKPLFPNIGHADARNYPDFISFSWTDSRLIKKNQDIQNNQRFIEASRRLFEELSRFNGKKNQWIKKEWKQLEKDLIESFGDQDQLQIRQGSRKDKYKSILGVKTDYDKSTWFDKAVRVEGIIQKEYFSKNNFKKSHWYQFQEQVIKHQDESWEILDIITN